MSTQEVEYIFTLLGNTGSDSSRIDFEINKDRRDWHHLAGSNERITLLRLNCPQNMIVNSEINLGIYILKISFAWNKKVSFLLLTDSAFHGGGGTPTQE